MALMGHDRTPDASREIFSEDADGETRTRRFIFDKYVDLDFRKQRQQLLKSELCNYAENIISKTFYPNNWPRAFLKSSTIFYNVKCRYFQLEREWQHKT